MFPPHEINTIPLLAILLDATLKGLVLVLLAWGVSRLLGKASAAGRHAVWTLAVIALLTLPILSAALPQWQIPLLPEWAQYKPSIEEEDSGRAGLPPRAPEEEFNIMRGGNPFPPRDKESIAVLPEDTAVHVLSDVTHDAAGRDSRRAEVSTTHRLNWPAWVMTIWLAGAVVVLLPLILGTLGAWRRVQRARPVTDESWLAMLAELAGSLCLTRAVRLRRSAGEDIPAVFGLFRPTILIPASADDWTEQRRRVVLLHELAHVKRRDCLTQLLAQLACVLYWFNPLAWLVSRQLRIERERACDDLVLAAGQRPSEYADHLLEMVRTLRSRVCPSLAAVAMAKKSHFEHRLLAILDAARPRKTLTKATTTAAFIVAVAILLPLAMLHVTPKKVDEPTTQPTEKTESSPENNSVAVDFNDAARVEFFGVSKLGPQPREWWRPNGEKIDTAPYAGAKLRWRYQYELLLRRQVDADTRWICDVPGARLFRPAVAPKDKDGNILPDRQAIIVGFNDTPKTMNLRYGMSTGPWKSVQTFQPNLKKAISIRDSSFDLTVVPPKGEGKNAEWLFRYTIPQKLATRILAVTKDGKTVHPTWHETWNSEEFLVGIGASLQKKNGQRSVHGTMKYNTKRDHWQTRCCFPVPPEQIKEFQLETSSVRWAQFENISLQPGVATDVKAVLLPTKKENARKTYPQREKTARWNQFFLDYPDLSGALSRQLKVTMAAPSWDELLKKAKPTCTWSGSERGKDKPPWGGRDMLWVIDKAGKLTFRLERAYTWKPKGKPARWIRLRRVEGPWDKAWSSFAGGFLPLEASPQAGVPSDHDLGGVTMLSQHAKGGVVYEIRWYSTRYDGTGGLEEQRRIYVWRQPDGQWRLLGEPPDAMRGKNGSSHCFAEGFRSRVQWCSQPAYHPVVEITKTRWDSETGEEPTGLPDLHVGRDGVLDAVDGTPAKFRWTTPRYLTTQKNDTIDKIAYRLCVWKPGWQAGRDVKETKRRQTKMIKECRENLLRLNPKLGEGKIAQGQRLWISSKQEAMEKRTDQKKPTPYVLITPQPQGKAAQSRLSKQSSVPA